MEGINNKFLVSSGGNGVIVLGASQLVMKTISADDALLLAAYLVCLAEPDASHDFEDVLNAVKNA